MLEKRIAEKCCGEVLWWCGTAFVVWCFICGFAFLWLCLVVFLYRVLGVLLFLPCRGVL